MAKIWTDQRKFETWLKLSSLSASPFPISQIPAEAVREIKEKASFDIRRIDEIEKVTKHDVLASWPM